MNNSEFIQHYCQALAIMASDSVSIISNLDLEFIYATPGYYTMFGVAEIINRKLKDSNHPGKEYAQQLRHISKKVISTKRQANFLIIYQFPNDQQRRCYICKAQPIVNPHSQDIIGINTRTEVFDLQAIGKSFNLVNHLIGYQSPEINERLFKLQLTLREQEILFLLMIGRSYKEISEIISKAHNKTVAATSINSIIKRQLFTKFAVYSVSSLISVAARCMALKEIPPSLIQLEEGIFELSYG